MGRAILDIAAVTGMDIFEVAKPFWRYGKTVSPNPKNMTRNMPGIAG